MNEDEDRRKREIEIDRQEELIEEIVNEVASNPSMGSDIEVAEYVAFVIADNSIESNLPLSERKLPWRFGNRNPSSQLDLLFRAKMNQTVLTEKDYERKQERILSHLKHWREQQQPHAHQKCTISNVADKTPKKSFLPPLQLPMLSIFAGFSRSSSSAKGRKDNQLQN